MHSQTELARARDLVLSLRREVADKEAALQSSGVEYEKVRTRLATTEKEFKSFTERIVSQQVAQIRSTLSNQGKGKQQKQTRHFEVDEPTLVALNKTLSQHRRELNEAGAKLKTERSELAQAQTRLQEALRLVKELEAGKGVDRGAE